MRVRSMLGAVIAAAALLSSCTDDDPTGGWSNQGLYACFCEDGRLGVGDHKGEAEDPCCTWHDDGTLDVEGVAGTWELDDDELTLTLDCSGDGCGTFTYQRDDSLNCP